MGQLKRVSLTLLLFCSVQSFCQTVFKPTSAVYFRLHDGVSSYEGSAKLLFNITLPEIEDINPGNCSVNDTGCVALMEVQQMRHQLKQYMEDFKKTKLQTPIRKRRQILLAAAAAAGGYLLHSAFTSLSGSLFGSEYEAHRNIDQIWKSLENQQKQFLLFRENVRSYSQQVSEVVSRSWWLETNDEERARRMFFYDRVFGFATKLNIALTRCASNFIPIEFITIDLFNKRISRIKDEISNYGYELSIPGANLASYLKLEISDCLMTEKSLYVLISIPVQLKTWKIMEMIPVPFSFNGKTCSLKYEGTEIVAVTHEDFKIIDESFHKFCDLVKNKLCFVPAFSRPTSITTSCAQAMYNHSQFSKLKAVCDFKCSDRNDLIIFSADIHTIVAINVKKLEVRCGKTSNHFEPPKSGGIELTIKCNCTYVLNNVPVESRIACIDERFHPMDIQNTFPHFLTLEKSNEKFTGRNWSELIPALNVSEGVDFVDNVPQFSGFNDIWLVTLSIIVFILVVAGFVAACLFFRIFR